jgi:hypothetical protein
VRESDTCLAILDEGRETQVKQGILSVGEERFGRPDEAERTRLYAINDLECLERITRHPLKAANWEVLLDTP